MIVVDTVVTSGPQLNRVTLRAALPCAASPCKNGGTCTNVGTGVDADYECNCPDDYNDGDTCTICEHISDITIESIHLVHLIYMHTCIYRYVYNVTMYVVFNMDCYYNTNYPCA